MDLGCWRNGAAVSGWGVWQHHQLQHAGEMPSAMGFTWTLKQSLPKPGLNDSKSKHLHFEAGLRTAVVHARSRWAQLHWNFTKIWVRTAAGLLPPVESFLGLSFCLWDKVNLLQHSDQELWICLLLLSDLRLKIWKTSISYMPCKEHIPANTNHEAQENNSLESTYLYNSAVLLTFPTALLISNTAFKPKI